MNSQLIKKLKQMLRGSGYRIYAHSSGCNGSLSEITMHRKYEDCGYDELIISIRENYVSKNVYEPVDDILYGSDLMIDDVLLCAEIIKGIRGEI